MRSNNFDLTDCINLLDVVIGETTFDGVYREDVDAYFNIKDTISIVDALLDKLYDAAKHRHDLNPDFKTARKGGEEAYAAILNWKDWCAKVEEELA